MEKLLISLVVALFAGYVGFRLGIFRDQIKLKNEKILGFKKLIAEEITVLKRGQRSNIKPFEEILDQLNVAAVEYSSTAGFLKKRKFDRLWGAYKELTSDREIIRFTGSIGYRNSQKALIVLKKIIIII